MPSKTFWIDTSANVDVVSGGTGFVNLMTGMADIDIRTAAITLLRTIIRLDLAYTVHDSGEGSQRVSLGIGVASSEAASAGIAATPNPEVMTEFPTRGWVWRAQYRIFGFAADQPAVYVRELDIDLRGRRKMENGEGYLSLANVALEGVAATVRVMGIVRQLYMVA